MENIKYLGLALLGTLILTFSACDNELNVLEDPKDIPVVYGFLSLTDTTQLIRIEKAFVDPTISAIDLAGNPDAIYYDESVQVSIANLSTGAVHNLNRIDATDIGYVRDEGIFATSPNILYQVENDELNLEIGTEYQIRIDRGEGFAPVTATTNIVGESRITNPRPAAMPPIIDFSFLVGTGVNVRWRTGDNAMIFDVVVVFNYQERHPGEDFVDKSVEWLMGSNITNNTNESTVEFERDALDFYSFLANEIPVDDNLTRRVVDLEVVINSGNNQLFEFLRIGEANLSITSSQDIPIYTNVLESDTIELRGIFGSSYQSRLGGIRMSNTSLDSLLNSSLTGPLNFQ